MSKIKVLTLASAAVLFGQVSMDTMAEESVAKCDLESIEELESPADQMRQYELCSDLMKKRLAMLKIQKEIKEVSSIELPASDSTYDQVTVKSQDEVQHPSVISVSGAGTNLMAEFLWPDGSRASVRKGMTVSGYTILDISSNGVRAKNSEGIMDIPIGMPVVNYDSYE